MADKRERNGSFKIIKWYLDFVGHNGEAMIFYAATLQWKGLKVPYSNMLVKLPGQPVDQKTHFKKGSFPQIEEEKLIWQDAVFQLKGLWEQQGKPLKACLFDSEEGSLNWNCWQPRSKVTLRLNGKVFEGSGYAEELILTVPAWKIPMQQLRWGRSLTERNYVVWIEIKGEQTRKWLWFNGELRKQFEIDDSKVEIKDDQVVLKLDQGEILEHEQKIHSVVKLLVRYLPGFNKIIPTNFLMADEYKWFSSVTEIHNDGDIKKGSAIHEFVNFNG